MYNSNFFLPWSNQKASEKQLNQYLYIIFIIIYILNINKGIQSSLEFPYLQPAW